MGGAGGQSRGGGVGGRDLAEPAKGDRTPRKRAGGRWTPPQLVAVPVGHQVTLAASL